MSLVPLRWPAQWNDAAAFDLLAGTPFNCLVLEGASAAAEQARKRGLEVRTSLPTATLQKPSWPANAPVIAFDGDWPQVRAGNAGAASAGPTGVSWVDSNGWKILLARALRPKSEIWLTHQPPTGEAPDASGYELALADSAAYGATWVTALHPELATGLAAKSAGALERWKKIASAAKFFAAHNARNHDVVAKLGILSNFSGSDQFLSHEVLNLTARRHLPYRVLWTGGNVDFGGLNAIAYVDSAPPAGALKERLVQFVNDGGLLILPPGSKGLIAASGEPQMFPHHSMQAAGKGRVAVAIEEVSDPYVLASDIHLIMGRRYDLIRVYNGASFNVLITKPPQNGGTVVHLLNYARRPSALSATVQLTNPHKRGRLWNVGQESAAEAKLIEADNGGVELYVPEFHTYLAYELS